MKYKLGLIIALMAIITQAFSFIYACTPITDPIACNANGAWCIWKDGYCQTNGKNGCLKQPCMARDPKWNGGNGKCVKAWIKLNTNVPFVGSCILMKNSWLTYPDSTPDTTEVNQINAFPTLIGGLMQIVTTTVLIVSFLMIVFAGVMMTMGGVKAEWFNKWKGLIFKVAGVLALLGLSGVILKIINPTFFS